MAMLCNVQSQNTFQMELICVQKNKEKICHTSNRNLQMWNSDLGIYLVCVLLSRDSLLLVSDTSLEFVSLYQVQSAHRSFPSH